MSRTFEAAPARRAQVPVLIGLDGPSGSGKTFTALRLATGMQTVTGGDIFVIDTEQKRATHYADRFAFKHVPFTAPFGALDYLEALRFCVKEGARVIVVDSMSHEHEGLGGLLDAAEEELKRLAGDDYGTWKADRFKMQSWIKPKAARRQLLNGLLQLNANFIFCFRAKETARPVKAKNPETGRSRTEIVPFGFTPICGDEFIFEMTANIFLPPRSNGVPQWESDLPGERAMMKLPVQFKGLLDSGKPLDEDVGRALALWARGDEPAATPAGALSSSHANAMEDDIVAGGDGAEPPAFEYLMTSASGETRSTLDGDLWASTMIARLEEPVPFDSAKATWERNRVHVEAAYRAGCDRYARRVEKAWRLRQPVKQMGAP